MLTHRLYYHDSYLQHFHAQVVSLDESGLRVVLDQTAFYPTSGGQPHDLGRLNAIPILDVIDEGEQIVHVLTSPGNVGPAEGVVDWPRRQDHMQQHSGQHLLSAIAAEEFGLQTVGVHFGAAASTIDLEGNPAGSNWLSALERRANEEIFRNRPIFTTFEDAATARNLRKPSDRPGTLRVVSIDGLDRSACGGTHVRQSAEIGPLLLGRTEKVRQSLRLEFRCGLRVLEEARRRGQALDEVQARLAEAEKTARKSLLDLAAFAGKDLHRATAPNERGQRIWQQSVADFDEETRAKASAFLLGGGALVILLAPAKNSVFFAASPDLGLHCGKLLQALLTGLGGKGGGGPQMAQGNVPDAALLDSIPQRLLSGTM